MKRPLTVRDRMPECDDRLRIPGSDCIVTVAAVPLTLEGRDAKYTIKGDIDTWNAALTGRRVMSGDLEYVSRGDRGPVEIEVAANV